ncbi:LytTR family DNA-binding domain-containing protein [Dyadobacter sp. CY326]|uniref:LytR/AlgR family response regulator transcription factor n=1 Tax=Dyadobacter sp. CY326 TaxID=2907300 RepID=UPI001F3B12A3|nr:LytTR family DNA-binding domain-containing protein [Dyadobacter sp. CY326]MCE7063993.1 LytTR family DNA-binding domain-containing protein [Dyadobacter sp. CY326]
MIRVLVIDDELSARIELHDMIMNSVPEISEVLFAASGREAKEILLTYEPDIVLMDIEMPCQSGFELLLTFKNPAFDIIFITADNQYAIKALRFNALDYLLKPVDAGELSEAIQRHLVNRASDRPKRLLVQNTVTMIGKKNVTEFRLPLPTLEGVKLFPLRQVIRLHADRNYTEIHLINKRVLIASKTLKIFEDMLTPYKFIRTHKSHLVNRVHIISVSHDYQYMMLSDGSRVEISRRKKEFVLHTLKVR